MLHNKIETDAAADARLGSPATTPEPVTRYNPRDLSIFGYANGSTLWHYQTGADPSALLSLGYFNASADMLRGGDFIMVKIACEDGRYAGGFLFVTKADMRAKSVEVMPMGGVFTHPAAAEIANDARGNMLTRI